MRRPARAPILTAKIAAMLLACSGRYTLCQA